ncbi:heavy metal-binding domain-containing protein [Allosphingosinicella sp.]|uniref:heavy metal-binding domain-containing protein n=1 Tax=Allosphingosinicella sp. TaxID=2823234 RepID=UPI0037834E44
MTERETVTVIGWTRRQKALVLGAVLAVALISGAAGYFFANGTGAAPTSEGSSRRILYWYDPMIPQERYPGPGRSSMNMDLIPKYAD